MFQSTTSQESEETELNIPSNFKTVMTDFVSDLSTTYPEYSFLWNKWTSPTDADIQELYLYSVRVYPERFFDILYQNEDIFNKDSQADVHFLPNVDFRLLYHCSGISENTRSALWKYLQLVLVTILKSVKSKDSFGDTANLFEGIDENVLQEKLAETISGISDFFKNVPEDSAEGEDDSGAFGAESFENMAKNAEEAFENMMNDPAFQSGEQSSPENGEEAPNAENIHDHLNSLFNGKIGNLAKELAEEISGDMKGLFEEEGAGVQTTQDLLKNMIKNPKKIMELMKTVTGKLGQKMKEGDITEEEIMKEASQLFGKMKGMGGKNGMGQFGDLFKSMAKSMGGAGLNMGAFTKMNKNMEQKDRMLTKLKHRQQMRQLNKAMAAAAASPAQQQQQQPNVHLDSTQQPHQYVFRVDETEHQEKSVAPLYLKSSPEIDLDALAKEIESTSTSTKPKHLKKKNKK